MNKLRKKQLYWITINTIIFLILFTIVWTQIPEAPEKEEIKNFPSEWNVPDFRFLSVLVILILYIGWGICGSFYYYYLEKDKLTKGNNK